MLEYWSLLISGVSASTDHASRYLFLGRSNRIDKGWLDKFGSAYGH